VSQLIIEMNLEKIFRPKKTNFFMQKNNKQQQQQILCKAIPYSRTPCLKSQSVTRLHNIVAYTCHLKTGSVSQFIG